MIVKKTILILIESEILKLDADTWNIAILERDVPCGFLAIDDLKDIITNLNVISDFILQIPKINLRIYNTEEFKDCELSNIYRTELYSDTAKDIMEYRADVLIEDQLAKYDEKIDKEIAKAAKRFGEAFDEEQYREEKKKQDSTTKNG